MSASRSMSSSPTPGQTAPADQATMVPSKDTHGFVANTIENGDYQEYAVRAARYVKDYPYRSASQKSAWTAVQYVKDHPYWSASMAMGLVPVVAPAAVGGLALGSVGLGAGGPVAGGLFSSAQAAGLVSAGSSLATLQSAAMGGYGAATVFGTIQGAAAVAHLAGYARFIPWGKKTATVEGSSDMVDDDIEGPGAGVDSELDNGDDNALADEDEASAEGIIDEDQPLLPQRLSRL